MSNRFEDLIAHGEGISIEFKEYKGSLANGLDNQNHSLIHRKNGIDEKRICLDKQVTDSIRK